MNQKEKHNSRKAQRRAQAFILVLCVLVLAAAALITHMLLQRAESSLRATVERSLLVKAQGQASALTLSMVTLKNQVRRLANTDLIRLFAVEANKASKNITALQKQAQNLGSRAPQSPPPAEGENAAEADTEKATAAQLVRQMPLMRRLLGDFTREGSFTAVRLMDLHLTAYLSLPKKLPSLTPAQKKAALEVLEDGQYLVLPVYRNADSRLIMDIVQPVFPPLYVESASTTPVGLLLVSCDVTEVLLNAPATESKNLGEGSRVLQRKDQAMEEILSNREITLRALPGWFVSEREHLAFSLRTLPSGQPVYAVALNILGTPLLLEQEITQESAQASYLQYREKMLITAGTCLVIIFMLLGMTWWWLVGQREKAVATELRSLYRTVNDQKQLLDSVNSNLADGIVLKDGLGKIGYVNQAFADMVGHSPESLPGTYFDRVISALTPGQTISPQMNKVLESGTNVTYTETLQKHGERRVYQVACSPFRAQNNKVVALVAVYRDITSMVRAQEQNQQLTYQMVKVLLRSIETVDPYLGGHSLLTAELAQILARHLHLDSIHASTVRAAANLSQIGMLQLPAELRTKAGKLTLQERQLLEQHVDFARAVLDDIDFGFPVQKAIYQMFERMDGSGYPQHLHGPDICIDARILAVANTFCALMRPRAYRQAMSVPDALRILSPDSGQYDPQVLESLHTFLQLPEGAVFLDRLIAAE